MNSVPLIHLGSRPETMSASALSRYLALFETIQVKRQIQPFVTTSGNVQASDVPCFLSDDLQVNRSG
ncbi:hypothetical protein [Shewanella sp. W3-18-1]|uniref:hypothetical protein n=1 Tax=Shewanella sp. (strain W3-18-1) TaxID=351745 RepID=UPI0012ED18AE|nr:hypothetical protein [Shewanella sp. W3-18-1]